MLKTCDGFKGRHFIHVLLSDITESLKKESVNARMNSCLGEYW